MGSHPRAAKPNWLACWLENHGRYTHRIRTLLSVTSRASIANLFKAMTSIVLLHLGNQLAEEIQPAKRRPFFTSSIGDFLKRTITRQFFFSFFLRLYTREIWKRKPATGIFGKYFWHQKQKVRSKLRQLFHSNLGCVKITTGNIVLVEVYSIVGQLGFRVLLTAIVILYDANIWRRRGHTEKKHRAAANNWQFSHTVSHESAIQRWEANGHRQLDVFYLKPLGHRAPKLYLTVFKMSQGGPFFDAGKMASISISDNYKIKRYCHFRIPFCI